MKRVIALCSVHLLCVCVCCYSLVESQIGNQKPNKQIKTLIRRSGGRDRGDGNVGGSSNKFQPQIIMNKISPEEEKQIQWFVLTNFSFQTDDRDALLDLYRRHRSTMTIFRASFQWKRGGKINSQSSFHALLSLPSLKQSFPFLPLSSFLLFQSIKHSHEFISVVILFAFLSTQKHCRFHSLLCKFFAQFFSLNLKFFFNFPPIQSIIRFIRISLITSLCKLI